MIYTTPAAHRSSIREVHPSQRQHHVHPVTQPLYVVTAISNSQRYYSRYRLYDRFEKMVEDSGAILYTVEMALRDRHHEVTQHDNPRHIQLRSPAELWHKENLLNLVIARLPQDWEYVAWIDADIEFARPDWAVETVHQLQHYHMIQMWSRALDIGPDEDIPGSLYEPRTHFQGFMYSYVRGIPSSRYGLNGGKPSLLANRGGSGGSGGDDANMWHSGYAWAARRSALSDVGGLGDISILGSADHHMAAALVGSVDRTIHANMSKPYKQYWDTWQQRAEQHIKRNVGYMPGLILHHWHGPKAGRRYVDRWKILVDNQFNPDVDIKRDIQGLWEFSGNKPRLRDQVREYFRVRNEDSVDG